MAEENFLDGVDEKQVTKDIWQHINLLYGHISHLVNYKYELLLYRIIKKRYIKIEHLEEVTGLSRQRLYQIVNAFEEKEVKRQGE
jgi:hypothetical protein